MKHLFERIAKAYKAFNTRDIDGALAAMDRDVEWANGMEGGFVHGHDGVRAYWTRQWLMIDPIVQPVAFKVEADGRVRVEVEQVVRDLKGSVLVDQHVEHFYSLRDGLVTRMEIGT